jgi:uncharacterized protein DUF2865
LVNADSFDLISRGSLRDDEPALTPGIDIPHRNDRRSGRHEGGTYRMRCVRLCDGFYLPVSFATRRQRFARDAKQCEQSCPTRARLFVHRNPGESADDMVDLAGRPYRKLPTAFCTEPSTLRIAPAAQTHGMRKRLPSIALTRKQPVRILLARPHQTTIDSNRARPRGEGPVASTGMSFIVATTTSSGPRAKVCT